MIYTVRPAALADAPALSAFAQATFPEAAPPVVLREAVQNFMDTALTEASFTRYIGTGSYSFTLAENERGEIIGYTGIDHTQPQPSEIPGTAAYLSKFYLGPAARGSGLASDLMERVKEGARAAGMDGIYLATHQENYRAQKFYEKMGYSIVGTREFQIAPGVLAQDFIYYLPLRENHPSQVGLVP